MFGVAPCGAHVRGAAHVGGRNCVVPPVVARSCLCGRNCDDHRRCAFTRMHARQHSSQRRTLCAACVRDHVQRIMESVDIARASQLEASSATRAGESLARARGSGGLLTGTQCRTTSRDGRDQSAWCAGLPSTTRAPSVGRAAQCYAGRALRDGMSSSHHLYAAGRTRRAQQHCQKLTGTRADCNHVARAQIPWLSAEP